MKDLTDQIALVTGASRGIGAGIAKALGMQGAYVVGTATTEIGLEKINQLFSSQGISGLACLLDVTLPSSIEALVTTLDEQGKAPVILVNNAGITRDNLLMRMKDEEWLQVLDANLTSLYRLSKAFMRAMMKARYGRIINITSVVGQMGNAGQCNYSAAKAGMIGFTRALARELGSRNITVNAVAPGFIDTDMTRELSDNQRNELLRQIPLNRLGGVDDIASVVAFLASKNAGYITGEVVNVNGGMYMG